MNSTSPTVKEINARLRDAQESAEDEVWGGYRYIALYDAKSDAAISVIDLGPGCDRDS